MPRFLTALALLLAAAPALARQPDPTLAVNRAEAASTAALRLSSVAFGEGQALPAVYSAKGGNISPPLTWSDPPEGTASFVLIVEDPEGKKPRPFVHWLVWNIAPDVRNLTDGAGNRPQSWLLQGRNGRGKPGYFGPKPSGRTPHRYVFQIFALDTRLKLPPDAPRQAVLAAMAGHVLAKGALVGTYAKVARP